MRFFHGLPIWSYEEDNTQHLGSLGTRSGIDVPDSVVPEVLLRVFFCGIRDLTGEISQKQPSEMVCWIAKSLGHAWQLSCTEHKNGNPGPNFLCWRQPGISRLTRREILHAIRPLPPT